MDDLIIFYVVSYNKKILLLGFENVIELAIKSKNKKEKNLIFYAIFFVEISIF